MSTEIVAKIGGLQRIDHQGEAVITLAMMDELHQRPNGTAGRNFRQHRGKMLEGRHFHILNENDPSTKFVEGYFGGAEVTVLTQRGYLLLVKSFKDDLAWQVQDALVEHYFRSVEQLPSTHLVGLEIARGIREGLRQGLEPLERKVEEGFAETNKALVELKFRVEKIEGRRSLSASTVRQHIDTIVDYYNGRCPCCESVKILDEYGNKLALANDEHWQGPSRNRAHETWIVCRPCNEQLRDSHKFKTEKRLKFDSFQQRREQKHTPLLMGIE
jgi:hypothetical protein